MKIFFSFDIRTRNSITRIYSFEIGWSKMTLRYRKVPVYGILANTLSKNVMPADAAWLPIILNKKKDRFNPIQARLFYPVKVQGTSLLTSGTIQAWPIKLCTVIVLLKAYQNMKINFKNLTYDVTMTSLLETMGKFGPSRNQTGNDGSFPKM